jgi:hypothetical protein
VASEKREGKRRKEEKYARCISDNDHTVVNGVLDVGNGEDAPNRGLVDFLEVEKRQLPAFSSVFSRQLLDRRPVTPSHHPHHPHVEADTRALPIHTHDATTRRERRKNAPEATSERAPRNP